MLQGANAGYWLLSITDKHMISMARRCSSKTCAAAWARRRLSRC
jgi:hypothetical protein